MGGAGRRGAAEGRPRGPGAARRGPPSPSGPLVTAGSGPLAPEGAV